MMVCLHAANGSIVEAGTVYHVLNRGNGRMRLFHKAGDYEAFERVLAECVMPNQRLGRIACPIIGISRCRAGSLSATCP
jgi:hypothetical protein